MKTPCRRQLLNNKYAADGGAMIVNAPAIARLKLPEIFGLGACLSMFLAFYKVEYAIGSWSINARYTPQNELILGSVFLGVLACVCYVLGSARHTRITINRRHQR